MKKCHSNFGALRLPPAILICAALLLYSSTAWPNKKAELKQLRQNLQTLQDNLSKTETSKQQAVNALRTSEQAISRSNRKLKLLKQDKKAAQEELKTINDSLKRTEKNIAFERKQLGQLLYQQYLSSPKDPLRLLLNQQDLNQATRNLHYYKNLSSAHATSMTKLNQQLGTLEALKRSQQNKMKDIATVQAEYTLENNRLQQEKVKREAILSDISGQLENQQKKITVLQHNEKRLATLVDQIGKLLIKRKPAIGLYDDELPGKTQKNKSFAALKRHLRLPIRGKLLSRFGSPRSGRYLKWEGLLIQAPSGTDIKVVANGQVVYADWLNGYGNLIIVNHGDQYMSIYGYNETLFRQVGDIIKAGDIIATVGNSGGNTESGLYFELRHRGKSFDPLTWVKKKR